ncbi:MAG: ABC transporter permease [Clostridia bacterium]|nr:ABC transporter permease [Deltaproteobacteria bacterium]
MTFITVMLVTFAISRLAPGTVQGDEIATSASLADWQTLRGENAPVTTQLAHWLTASLTFDFGRSFVDGRSVRDRVVEGLAATVPLTAAAALLAYGLGIPLGFVLALRNGRRLARVITFGLFALHGIPVFWTALLASLAARRLSLPTPRGDNAIAAILAVICLSYPGVARIARYQRAAVLETLDSGFVQLARAKGLPRSIVLGRYVLGATIHAPLSLLASELPWLLGGSVVVERVFGINGMGQLTFESILRRDLPVVMGVTALVAGLTIVSTLLADGAYALIDPRRRA